MNKKQEVLDHVESIKNGCRDSSRDKIYLSMAHDYLQTFDWTHILKQIKSVQLPF